MLRGKTPEQTTLSILFVYIKSTNVDVNSVIREGNICFFNHALVQVEIKPILPRSQHQVVQIGIMYFLSKAMDGMSSTSCPREFLQDELHPLLKNILTSTESEGKASEPEHAQWAI